MYKIIPGSRVCEHAAVVLANMCARARKVSDSADTCIIRQSVTLFHCLQSVFMYQQNLALLIQYIF